jgi:hypothetical protein
VSRSRFSVRPQIVTVAPSSTSRRAHANAIPEPPPVANAPRPLRTSTTIRPVSFGLSEGR